MHTRTKQCAIDNALDQRTIKFNVQDMRIRILRSWDISESFGLNIARSPSVIEETPRRIIAICSGPPPAVDENTAGYRSCKKVPWPSNMGLSMYNVLEYDTLSSVKGPES